LANFFINTEKRTLQIIGNIFRVVLTPYTIGPETNSKFGTTEYAIVTQTIVWLEWAGICISFSAVCLRQVWASLNLTWAS
jgi:hypothetical protein